MELIRTYHDEEKKKKKEEYYKTEEGNKEGKYSVWHINGQKYEESNYKNNSLEGKYSVWHSNGQKGIESSYKNGKSEGKYSWWYSNGQKGVESNYKNGILDGEHKYWDEKGILKEYKYHLPKKEIIIKDKIYGYKALKKLITKKKQRRIKRQLNKIRTQISTLEPLIYNCIIEYLTEQEKIKIIRTNKKQELMYKSE